MTEPYYADEWVTLYHGDCLEVRAVRDAYGVTEYDAQAAA